jgi:acetyl esterase/lipase
MSDEEEVREESVKNPIREEAGDGDGGEGGGDSRFERISYGVYTSQFFNLFPPDNSVDLLEGATKRPIMILIHGGYWAQCYNLNNALCDGLVGFFQAKGYWVCHLEYRRGNRDLDRGEGGWPETNEDIIHAFNRLEELTLEEAYKVRSNF